MKTKDGFSELGNVGDFDIKILGCLGLAGVTENCFTSVMSFTINIRSLTADDFELSVLDLGPEPS